MINNERIVSVTAIDLISLYGLILKQDTTNNSSLAKLSDDEITQIAINWIEKINPGWTSELVVDDIYSEIYSDSSYISFKRYVNGIPFCNNSVTMQINKKNGTVIDYYSNWQYEQNIPSPNNAITLEEAQKLAREYDRDNKFQVSIYEIEEDLRYK